MKLTFCYLIVILFLLNACGTNMTKDPVLLDFEEQAILSPVDSINLEIQEILSPEYIQYKKGKLIFKNRQSEFLLSIYDVAKKKVVHTIPVGQGPNEAVDIALLKNNKDTCVSFRNIGTQIVQELLIESSVSNIRTVQQLPEESRVLNLIETKDYYIGSGVLAEKRFVRINKQDNKYSYEIDFPNHEKLYGLNQRQLGVVFNAQKLQPKPDGKKFVTFLDGLMDIYSIKSEGIELLHKKEHYYPSFRILSDQYGALASFDKDVVSGYGGVDADDKYIYVLYSELTFAEKIVKGNSFEYLLIYDWAGNAINVFRLEQPLDGIAIDDKGFLYGLAFNPEAIVYKYDITKL